MRSPVPRRKRRLAKTVVLLNGPFGVGKSSVARRLRKILGSGEVLDPDLIAWPFYGLLSGRIQIRGAPDLASMRLGRWYIAWLVRFLKRLRRGPLIVPITVLRIEHFDALVGAMGPKCVGVRLTARPKTLIERIENRRDFHGSNETGLKQFEAGILALTDPHFGPAIVTDGRSVEDIADEVADLVESTVDPQSAA